MKKYFLSMIALAALTVQAQVYYLIPSVDKSAEEVNVYDVLPWEGDGTLENNEVSPERRAYEWFAAAEGFNGDGILTIKDIKDGKLTNETVRTLWINIDRVGLDLETGLDAMFTNDVHMALKNFVKAGGNLFLTKQALRLVCQTGRCSWWPEYKSAGYVDGADTWHMMYNFDCEGNVDNHSAYRFAENKEKFQVDWETRFPLTSGEGTYRRTDNNNGWGWWDQYDAGNGPLNREGITLNERRAEFEAGQNCRILGGWGHTRYIDYAGMVEFFPGTVGEEEYKGTIMVMGLAAYQWGLQNTSEYNVQNLTKGILTYLEGEAHWLEGEAPRDGKVGESFKCTPLSNFEGYHIDLVSSDPEVASFGEGGILTLNKKGEATIRAIYVGDGVQSCKTELVLETLISVSDTATSVTNMNKPAKAEKVIVDGRVFIIQNNQRYDIFGKQVD